MKKKFCFIIFMMLVVLVNAQESNQIGAKKFTQFFFLKLDYLSAKMPLGEANLGLSGIHYLINLNNWAYAGIGMYGSVNGFRGGLFTLGADVGLKNKFGQRWFLDTGFHIGGGGGSGAPDGGGAFILPHANLGYQFAHFSLEAGYSYINFFNHGAINSHQLNLALQVPLSFDYSLFKNAEAKLNTTNLESQSGWNKKSNKRSFLFHLDNLALQGSTKDDNGNSLINKTIRLVGVSFNAYLNNNSFVYLKADGAYHGIPAGFMDIVLGAGHEISFNKNRTNLVGKFGIGAAGGGGVDIQGGFIINPNIAIEQKLFNGVYLTLNTGYFLTPNSHFIASTYGAGLKYQINQNGLKTSNKSNYKYGKLKGIETVFGQSLYNNVQRDNNITQDLYSLFLQINFFIKKHVYLAGETSFANFGNAGAYAEGLFGFGLTSRQFFNNKLNLFAQLLVGAAGGGNVSTGQGLIVKPALGFNYYITNKLGLRAAIGKVKATGGNGLNSNFLNIGLSYRLTFLTAHN